MGRGARGLRSRRRSCPRGRGWRVRRLWPECPRRRCPYRTRSRPGRQWMPGQPRAHTRFVRRSIPRPALAVEGSEGSTAARPRQPEQKREPPRRRRPERRRGRADAAGRLEPFPPLSIAGDNRVLPASDSTPRTRSWSNRIWSTATTTPASVRNVWTSAPSLQVRASEQLSARRPGRELELAPNPGGVRPAGC